MPQLDVADVHEFTGNIIYQYIMQYVCNIRVAARGRNLCKCFEDSNTNAQEILCANIADHDSSGYHHM